MKKDYIKYVAALLLFGSNGVVSSHISLTSYEIVLLRSVLGCALLTGIFFLTGHRPRIRGNGRDLLFISLSGAAMAADWLLLFEAYKRIGVSLSMIINYCGPAIVIAVSAICFREKLPRRKVIALCAALLGAILVSGPAAVRLDAVGLACAVLSAFAYAALVLCDKMAKQIHGMENATIQLFATCAVVAAAVAAKQGLRVAVPAGDWLPVLWIGLVNTGLACYCYFSSIGSLPVQTVAICGYLEPLSAVLMSVVFLRETMLPLQICGAVLIIGGAIYGETAGEKAPCP